ncbi:thiamine diphosphokinase [Paenibacillus sp. PL2-23]|uniref:thiamine diphosphokinase n=1 Tax=Paenibacillus sp. PL2-23 TaxID=2100729 RepID=UPI0030F72177
MKRIVIFAGGALGDWALALLRTGDTLIGADSGALFLLQSGLTPEVAIGDFDSVNDEELRLIRERSGTMIQCDPVDKDYTDSEMAFRYALDMKPTELLLLGGIGTRFDHSLANVHLLALADAAGIQASIQDPCNRIRVISSTTVIPAEGFPQTSLLPLSEQAAGITLTGFQYPLQDATLTIGQSLGISNLLCAEEGLIELREGKLLVIQSRD